MSRKYKFHDNDQLYFISFAVIKWIDIFIREEYKEEILKSWKYCQENKGLDIYAWCIMPSHIHMIIGSRSKKLDEIIRDMKKHTSIQLRKSISNNPKESRKEWIMDLLEKEGIKNSGNSKWQFWQQHNKPLVILNQEMFNTFLLYIHLNPVVEGFVKQPEDWKYSSANVFANQKGLIELCY